MFNDVLLVVHVVLLVAHDVLCVSRCITMFYKCFNNVLRCLVSGAMIGIADRLRDCDNAAGIGDKSAITPQGSVITP